MWLARCLRGVPGSLARAIFVLEDSRVVPFSVPPTAKACLELMCQLRDGDRDAAWSGFVNVTASGQWDRYATVWEQTARMLGLTVTGQNDPKPCAFAVRENYCLLTNRVAWRT